MMNDQVPGQNQNQVPSENRDVSKENERKGRGLFYGIVALATFIIMAVGATYAYFTATTTSGEGSVRTGSTTLQLKYISYGAAWMNADLIPATTNVAEYSFEYQNDTTLSNQETLSNILCKDDFGNSICSVYVFQVYNNANSPQSVNISLVSSENGFGNLWTMAYAISLPTDSEQLALYNPDDTNHNGLFDPKLRKGNEDPEADTTDLIDVTDANGNVLNEGSNVQTQYSPIFINRKGVVKTLLKVKDTANEGSRIPSNVKVAETSGTVTVADEITINGGEISTFALVLYISETGEDQTNDTPDGVGDAAKQFTGQVVVGSGDGSGGVTGTISTLNVNDLQSNQNTSGGSGSGEPSGGEPSSNEPTP